MSDDPAKLAAEAILHADSALVTAFLRKVMHERSEGPEALLEAIGYSLFGGGKHLRSTLAIECCRLAAGRVTPDAVAVGASLELIHTFSLVHDDLPAMDDDDLRRGRPTNHKVFGEATAILAGDAMVVIAFEVLARHTSAERVAQLVAELGHASGVLGMVGGQVMDMEGENQELPLADLARMHERKTGALLKASCRMGAIAGGGDAAIVKRVDAYGRGLGLAFQIVDDVLDVTATPAEMGKQTGKDIGKGKNTYPRHFSPAECMAMARREMDAACGAIADLPGAAPLLTLAEFVMTRRH